MTFHDPQAAPNAWMLTQEAAPRLGITLQQAQVGGTEELLPEFPMIAKEHPDALFVYPDVILSSYPRPQQLAEFAIKANLPMMSAFRFFTDAGGFMSYGATASEIYKSAAEQSLRCWLVLCRARCRCDRRRGLSWSSTIGLRRSLESQSRHRSLCEPTR